MQYGSLQCSESISVILLNNLPDFYNYMQNKVHTIFYDVARCFSRDYQYFCLTFSFKILNI